MAEETVEEGGGGKGHSGVGDSSGGPWVEQSQRSQS